MRDRMASGDRGVDVVGIEATQGIQFFDLQGQGSGAAADNSLTLVARKPTIVRVYVAAASSPLHRSRFPDVVGRVRYRPRAGDDAGEVVLRPVNGPIAANGLDRGTFDHSLVFVLPAVHCLGVLDLTVEIGSAPVPTDLAFAPAAAPMPELPRSAAALSATLAMQSLRLIFAPPRPRLRVQIVLVDTLAIEPRSFADTLVYGRPAPSPIDVLDLLRRVRAVVPVEHLPVSQFHSHSLQQKLDDGGWTEVLQLCRNLRAASGVADLFIGILPLERKEDGSVILPFDILGYGGGGVAAALAWLDMALAQEMAHALGLNWHAPCGNPGSVTQNFPRYGSYPEGSIGEFGVDLWRRIVRRPEETFDFMSYCGPSWVSPYTWQKLDNALAGWSAAQIPSGRRAIDEEGATLLVLNLTIDAEGRVSLQPSYRLRGRPPLPLGPSDIYCDLFDAAGRLLGSARCMASAYRPDQATLGDTYQAVVALADEAVAVGIRRERQRLAKLDLPSTPIRSLTIDTPDCDTAGGGEVTLKWHADGDDADSRYLVRYSTDGGRRWLALACDRAARSLTIDPERLPGGDACCFEVVAAWAPAALAARTDTFSLPRKPRRAHILAPSGDGDGPGARPLMLSGDALSPDFASPAMDELFWHSNVDGFLGAGVELAACGLSPGAHVITLTAPDGLGRTSSASVLVRVGETIGAGGRARQGAKPPLAT